MLLGNIGSGESCFLVKIAALYSLTCLRSDMKDRIGMRAQVQNTLAWATASPDDPSDLKAWRTSAGYLAPADDADPLLCESDICRAIRGFVGRKPFLQDIDSS